MERKLSVCPCHWAGGRGQGAGQNDDMTVADTSCEGAADCKERGKAKLAKLACVKN